MSDITKSNTVILWSGSVEYDLADAVEHIESVIEALEEARDEGAEYVVLSSGNARGAKWLSISADTDTID